ncbi:MAG: AraC family transcriptional regulator [Clostridiaceae bacterium]|nr:AraC family transcriptional regulator [Clostridiaceae bacterium]
MSKDALKHYTLDQCICREEQIALKAYKPAGSEPEHTHEFLEIVSILAGSGRHLINARPYPVSRGDLLFITTGQTHAFTSDGDMQIVNCLVDPGFIDRELLHADNALEILALSSFADFDIPADKIIPHVHFAGADLLDAERLIQDMLEEFTATPVNYRPALKGYLLVLLTKIFRAIASETGSVLPHLHRVAPEILQYIENNLNRRITLQELAQRCFYNPSYFSRVFRDVFGKNLTEYIAEKRIQEADRLLCETTLSIEEISSRVGYQDRKQFYEVYKRLLGVSPGARRTAAGL